MVFTRVAILSALVLAISSVSAHVTLAPKFTEPGQNLTTAFHVPHGCSGSPTVNIFATVPKEITVLTAQQVNNWTLTTVYRDSTNTTIDTLNWSGYLDAHSALDFPIVLSVPNADLSSNSNVTLYFPVVQTCKNTTVSYTMVPPETVGESSPSIVIVKNATQAAADAIAIKTTATASASGAAATSSSASAGNSIYAGMLPVAAVIAAVGFSL